MPKPHQLTEKDLEQIEEAMKRIQRANLYRKLQVLQLRASGRKNSEIAEITGYSESRVSHLISEYAANGIDGFTRERRKGGNHRRLSFEEEKRFLAPYGKKAQEGRLITAADIRRDYEKMYGRAATGTVYDLLKRHEWRKASPRPKHPKAADREAQEASKKLKPKPES